MIAVDTSALMEVLLGGPEADACTELLEGDEDLLLSAGTLAEALIVASRRNVHEEMVRLVDGLGFDIVSITPATARRVAQIYQRWGKGLHPAGLNFGDCFAYDVAKEHACRLLYVGRDFAQTDVESALS